MNHRSNLALITLVASGALLAGCSGGASSEGGAADTADRGGQTYAFSGSAGPATSIRAELPQELLQAMGSGAEEVLITGADLKAHALDSSTYCAADIAFTLSDGALDKLSTPVEVDPTTTDAYLERLDALTTQLWPSSSSPRDTRVLLGETGVLEMTGAEREQTLREIGMEGFDVDAYLAGKQRIIDEISEEIQNADPVANLLDRIDAKPLSEFNEASPEYGLYLSEDATKGVQVVECALNPQSEEEAATSRFPRVSSDVDGIETFASFDYTVMKDGKITIIGSTIQDWQQDSSGNWLEK